jgi:hypothetical protein
MKARANLSEQSLVSALGKSWELGGWAGSRPSCSCSVWRWRWPSLAARASTGAALVTMPGSCVGPRALRRPGARRGAPPIRAMSLRATAAQSVRAPRARAPPLPRVPAGARARRRATSRATPTRVRRGATSAPTGVPHGACLARATSQSAPAVPCACARRRRLRARSRLARVHARATATSTRASTMARAATAPCA